MSEIVERRTARFLGGPFTAHVTGNLVVLAAHLVSGDDAAVGPTCKTAIRLRSVALPAKARSTRDRDGMTADLVGGQDA
jgi:hypothetical protein